MRHIGTILGLAAAVVFAGGTAVQATETATGLVDGSVTIDTTTCSWTDAVTSNVPPNTLRVDNNTVNPPGGNLSCNDGTRVEVTNDPVVTFDDAAGTATADRVSITATQSGVTCSYTATDVTLTRKGTGRDYSGGGYTGNLTSGGFMCPNPITISSASLSFH